MLDRKPLEMLVRRSDRVNSILTVSREEADRLEAEVGVAKGRLLYKDEVTAVLDKAQDALHEKTVGRYEKLLTAILRDVFPGDDSVQISVSTKRGATAIDFSVTVDGGYPEDVMNGRGGAVANVMSIALRFIALSQTNLRPFVVLDEADCWMAAKRVPALSKVIRLLAEQVNIQTLVITHNSPDAFRDHSLMVELFKEGDTVRAEPSFSPSWEADERGVRGIYLNDFMSHADTYIPLSNSVTVIVGDSDLGKSAIVTGLRSLLYGEGAETMIRHRAEKAHVSLDLGPEGSLLWERTRKGAKKTRYALLDRETGAILHETMESQVPEWLMKLGFGYEEDLDIQIGHQKRPVFLLDQPDTKRASILSVGKESSWMSAMRKQYNDDVRKDRDVIKQGERRLQMLSGRLKLTEQAELVTDTVDDMSGTFEQITETEQLVKQGGYLVTDLMQRQQLAAHEEVRGVEAPELYNDIPQIEKMIADTAKLAPLTAHQAVGGVEEPVIQDVSALQSTARRLQALEANQSLSSVDAVNEPEFAAVDKLQSVVRDIDRIEVLNAAMSPVMVTVAEPEIQNTESIRQMGKQLVSYIKPIKQADHLLSQLVMPQAVELDESPVHMEKMAKQISEVVESITMLTAEISKLSTEIEANEKEQETLIEQNGGLCPVCDTVMQEGGVHSHD